MKFKNKTLLLVIIFSILSFSLFNFNIKKSLADGIDDAKQKLLKILGNIIRFLFTILMIASSALLIFLGIKYITNWGKPEELHKSILYVVLGIVLLILSLFIPNLIKDFIENATK
jgi:hypothetical protein